MSSQQLRPVLLNAKRGLWMACVVLACNSALAQQPSSFDCSPGRHCDVPREQPYPHLVVGTIRALASPEETAKLFTQLSKRGWWKQLPDDAQAFARAVSRTKCNTGFIELRNWVD